MYLVYLCSYLLISFLTMRFCWSGLSCSSDLMLYCKEMIIYVHNYWWTHNKINCQLFFHNWYLYLFATNHLRMGLQGFFQTWHLSLQNKISSTICPQIYFKIHHIKTVGSLTFLWLLISLFSCMYCLGLFVSLWIITNTQRHDEIQQYKPEKLEVGHSCGCWKKTSLYNDVMVNAAKYSCILYSFEWPAATATIQKESMKTWQRWRGRDSAFTRAGDVTRDQFILWK